MPKSVFISYSWKQGEWVWDRLVPCLQAGEAEVLIDRDRFEAARALERQMDEVQDRADLNILVFSPDYLTSKRCQHEMKRAIQRDPEFKDGVTIPVKRVACDLPAAIRRPHRYPPVGGPHPGGRTGAKGQPADYRQRQSAVHGARDTTRR